MKGRQREFLSNSWGQNKLKGTKQSEEAELSSVSRDFEVRDVNVMSIENVNRVNV